ncbi:MAG: ATP-dependent DNA helicase RecG, partial [Anaerolineaceae bacterium]|nr:ATP-dependent DNA helicase RecG [Anaerolineaceae bacterium]
VAGGLKNFKKFLYSKGKSDNITLDAITLFQKYFENYSNLSSKSRNNTIKSILAWISNGSLYEELDDLNKIILQEVPSKNHTSPNNPFQDPALYADIRSIKGIGDRNYKLFEKLGISNILQLLRYFPRRYQDFSQLKTINTIKFGEEITLAGIVAKDVYTRKSNRGKLKISETVLTDSTGSLRLTWFNQPFIAKQISQGISIVVSGKVDMYRGRFVMNNPAWERMENEQIHTNRIVPIYPATAGITQRQIRKIINQNLDFWAGKYKEYLPPQILRDEDFPNISSAIKNIHFPPSFEQLQNTRKRFAFEEIFFLQLGVLLQKNKWQSKTARKYFVNAKIIENRISKLPFILTNAQLKALKDIENDLASGKPMNRLLQGDVGSGKTVVAKFAAEVIIDNNAQVAIMAPTSILAEQHYRIFSDLLIASGAISADEIALLLGQTPKNLKVRILDGLRNGKIKCVIGTHALIEKNVFFKDLQLVIIDEQHKFGVNQRNKLSAKGSNIHMLVMSATPIPRSLALTVYGDLDITTIDEMPPGRKVVKTILLSPEKRGIAYGMIKDQIAKGFQAFIVYPMIDAEEDEESYKSAVKEHERLQKSIFPENKVGLLHGRMKPTDKDAIMNDFRNKKFDILVSTTVIEVGVDIPNVTIVLIESANFFGLAQLHQIRGRVGRNSKDSICVLIPENENASENERLIAMTKISDGFKLAEIDLAFRGPGEFLGVRQSGYSGFKFANFSDTKLIEASRKYAQYIIDNDLLFKNSDQRLLLEELINHWPEIKGLISEN